MARIYDYLLTLSQRNFDRVRMLKETPRGSIALLRHRQTGTRYIFREFSGSGAVYRKLLGVRCPHLPNILETGERDGRVAVLEEYIQGDTLYYLLQGGTMSPALARGIVLDLCEALWVLHGLGAVHRDIKPENVMLRQGNAVLIDFDASRVVKAGKDADTQVLGTTGFAAPEQYGLSQTDCRADIYSLGVLLNVMLTGRHPSKEIAHGRYGRVVQKCTMMNPSKRYRSVLHLMEALS